MLAPIAIFIFDRPEHLKAMLATLQRCNLFAESPLYVFGDGPSCAEHQPHIEAARAVARDMLGDRATYVFSPDNKGLARSIIDGVAQLTESHGQVIVIEDDLELHPYFLTYINDALTRYVEDDHVFQVSGHCFDVPEFADRNSAVVLPLTTTWGWGTWARAWRQFEEIPRGWEELQTDKGLRRRFNLGGTYDYTSMLSAFMAGRNRSWGVRFYWTVFRAGGVSIFPPVTLVRNCGMDGSGTHGRGLFRRFESSGLTRVISELQMPAAEVVDTDLNAVQRAVYRQNGGLRGAAIDQIKRRVQSWMAAIA
jgi:hypothetical protein